MQWNANYIDLYPSKLTKMHIVTKTNKINTKNKFF